MGLPPYNGGLFDEREVPLLSHIALPDRTLAGLIDALSREASSGSPRKGGIPGTMRVITNAGPGVKHDIQRALNVRNLNRRRH